MSAETIKLIGSLLELFQHNKIEMDNTINDDVHCKNECSISLDDILLPSEVYSKSNDELIDNNCNDKYEEYEENSTISDSEHTFDELLPKEIYCESDSQYNSDEYSISEHIYEDLLPEEVYEKPVDGGQKYDENMSKKYLMTGNAAILTGPATIDINGRKALITYPFPCQIIHTFEDTQLGVKLAFPYNDIHKKLPSVLIERDCDEIDLIEQEYMENIQCDNLGYESIKDITSLDFQ